MVVFATYFVISTFVVGSSFCCLALWTISKSKTLQESFGVLCKWQMRTDLTLLVVTSFYSLIPKEYAPLETSSINIIICFIAEISSGAMHDLFAVNRFVYIVFPSQKNRWKNATPKILIACAFVIAWHTLVMMIMDALIFCNCTIAINIADVNLYWVYDRETYIWRMTDTAWTEFYIKYFEVYWSTCEICLIVALDTATFSYIMLSKAKISDGGQLQMNRRAEARLIMQSFCQCIPTTTVNIIFFFILPYTTSHNLQIVYSAIWIVTNILDAFIILLFHFPHALATRKKTGQTTVSVVSICSAYVSEAN